MDNNEKNVELNDLNLIDNEEASMDINLVPFLELFAPDFISGNGISGNGLSGNGYNGNGFNGNGYEGNGYDGENIFAIGLSGNGLTE